MRGFRTSTNVAIALAAASCAGACGYDSAHVRPASCDFALGGVCVTSSVPGVGPEVVDRQLRMSLSYWGAHRDALDGWAVVYSPEPVTCLDQPASGCTWYGSPKTIHLQALDPACPETAQLVHELGHVLFGDGAHSGRWWSWCGEQLATEEIVRAGGSSPGCAGSGYYAEGALEERCGARPVGASRHAR